MKPAPRALAIGLGLAVLALASSGAGADTTFVNPSGGGSGSERCLTGTTCVGGAYNGAFSLMQVFDNDLGPGVSLVRVDDGLDRIWANAASNGGQVQALARYAGDNSQLGFDAGAGYQTLTGVFLPNNKVRVNSASSFAGDPRSGDFIVMADSWTTIPLAAGLPFAFVLNDLSMAYRITSNPGAGAGVGSSGYANSALPNLDYMVTFQVVSAAAGPQQHYFIAWEDRNPRLGNTGDFDYNDYIAEVRFANPVPEPQTYALLLAGLLLLGFTARGARRQAAVA